MKREITLHLELSFFFRAINNHYVRALAFFMLFCPPHLVKRLSIKRNWISRDTTRTIDYVFVILLKVEKKGFSDVRREV
jgi:hypothetical protein